MKWRTARPLVLALLGALLGLLAASPDGPVLVGLLLRNASKLCGS